MEKKRKRSITRTIILALLALAIGYTVYATATQEKVKQLKVGDPAPDFVLKDMQGNEHKLSDYKGQGVFLNFWGTWCPPCVREMPAMDRQYKAFQGQGVQMLAINIAQTDFEVQSFIDSYNLSFPVVIDRSKDVMTKYNIDQLPATILVAPDGTIQQVVPPGEMSESTIATYLESIKP